jgi:hypothetical protein
MPPDVAADVRTCGCAAQARWRCALCGPPDGEFLACSRRCLEAHHAAAHDGDPPENYYARSLAAQRAGNRENPRNWVDFEHHRAHTMGLVESLAPASGICVLGAGNCDDLDLERLVSKFRDVHLVDWDGEALERGMAQAPAIVRNRIVAHAGVDLTGLLETLETWGDHDEAFANAAATAPARIAANIGRSFDVVLSSSLLSQLSVPFYAVLARTPDQWARIMHALARIHFSTAALLARGRGHCVLIGDVLHPATRPGPAPPELGWDALDPAAVTALRTAMPLRNPEFLLQTLQEPDLAQLFERPTLSQPWVWNVEDAAMLAYGIVVRTTGVAAQAAARAMLSPLDPGLVDIHTRSNGETAGHWDLYEGHRHRLRALVEQRPAGDRVCVLGAGNANGLDLAALSERFAEVHLCDLDGMALALAAERQTAAVRAKLVLHAPIDLSGLLQDLPRWGRVPPSPEELTALPESAAARITRAVGGGFDLVVSECMLTQVYWTCFKALGNGPALKSVVPAALETHLRSLLELAKPGGSCLLVTDSASSSEGLPLAELLAESDPLGLLHELDRRGTLFTGTSVSLVVGALREGPLSAKIEGLRVIPPWLWQAARKRSLLVYAVEFCARGAAAPLLM